jgi:Rad52/22 family double-strand break repair protein
MNNVLPIEKPQTEASNAPLRSIREIIADLSKPLAKERLKTRTQGGKTLTYLPWYQAVRYLDKYAPGWSSEIRKITQIGDNLVMTVRVTIPCLEGLVWREASALEPIQGTGYGDAATNCESAALRRAAAKFNLALYLYDK